VIRTLDVKTEGPVVCIAHFNTESASLLVYATQVRVGGRGSREVKKRRNEEDAVCACIRPDTVFALFERRETCAHLLF